MKTPVTLMQGVYALGRIRITKEPTSIHWPFPNASGFSDAFGKASGTLKPKLVLKH